MVPQGMLKSKRVTLFCGHYGSGKTNVSINYALTLAKEGKKVCIADMDIVNPYFRTKDSENQLKEMGIRLISPAFANTNVDLPALPQELYGVFRRKDEYVVLDIGGDDRGAYALGRFAPFILEENDYNNFFVTNFYRPLTKTSQEALEVLREIEVAGKVPFTAIINNSNLGELTTLRDVKKTNNLAKELAELSGLPMVMTSIRRDLCLGENCENIFPIDLQAKYF